MTVPAIQPAFTTGEIAPSLFGRIDVSREHSGAATMRNFYVGFRGGAYSRAGTSFVGFSKQTGRAYPPRLIPFQFSINQGLALEFGNYYMRVIQDGAFVTDVSYGIIGATQANPLQVTIFENQAVSAATSNNSGVTASYNGGDTITLAGGVYAYPGVLSVATTFLNSTSLSNTGSGYAPGDTITITGGAAITNSVLTVGTTQVTNVTTPLGNPTGSGGTPNGYGVVQGTTGTGTKFTATVYIGASGRISGSSGAFPPVVLTGGSYTVNPTLVSESVTGISGNAIGITGAVLNLTVGVRTAGVTTPGSYLSNPVGGILNQGSTSGSGSGAQFNGIFAPLSLTISNGGSYSTFPTSPASQASTSGQGVGATFTLTSTPILPVLSIGDWIAISNVSGMTQLNGNTYVISNISGGILTLKDVYGNNVNSTGYSAYTSGGFVSRIYTLPAPYSEQDLTFLKYTQSADEMTLCCVNQDTFAEYPVQLLTRTANNKWTIAALSTVPTVSPPSGSITVQTTSTGSTNYAYQVTSVNPNDGTESIQSATGSVSNAVDISTTAGSNTITWSGVAGVNEYNIYKAYQSDNTPVPAGALFGYAGSAYGTRFVDQNIIPDLSQVPPLHQNPFARGQVIGGTITAGGTGYTTASASITTSTGSGAILEVIINTTLTLSGGSLTPSGGPVSAIVVQDPGEGYAPTDTVTISGNGSGAKANLVVGAQTGTYPGVASYFQERAVFANTLNNPDTYFMSQPGSYANFDVRIPTIASDAITGTPWAVQVNGIQWMLQTPGGLIVMTGSSAWMLAGAGSFATNVQPISPSSQTALPQAFTGCNNIVQPHRINYDIVYVESKGSLYYDLPYQLYALSEPIDLTEMSPHLFVGYQVIQDAWCEQPYKTLWSVRNDGTMLSLAFYKSQQVAGWARHDTEGLWVSNCSITEPPVDALYLAAQRQFGSNPNCYTIERMNNRIWQNTESTWCVDCGLTTTLPTPNATLTASSATGLGQISGYTNLVGGNGYSPNTVLTIVDSDGLGPGVGATATPTISGGVITGISIVGGTGYVSPQVTIFDPEGTGSGFSVTLTLNNSAIFTASTGVFTSGDVGNVIRMGGGQAIVTAYTSSTVVTANIVSPIVDLIPNTTTPQQATYGNWTYAIPATTIGGLEYLAGSYVTGLADGNVVPLTQVSAQGTITLSTAATLVTLGFPYTCQLQSVYLDEGQPTVQGQRKKIAAVTARVEASGNFQIGSNQVDGSTVYPNQVSETWNSLSSANVPANSPYGSTVPSLYTGDIRIPVQGGFQRPGQVCVQQSNPLPLAILAFIPDILAGDSPEVRSSPRAQGRGR